VKPSSMRSCEVARAVIALVACVISLGALFSPSAASAQDQTGSLGGEIVDQDGVAVPAARIVARSATQIGGDRSVQSDRNGRFRFLGLTPGTFEIRVSKTGFAAVRQADVYVPLGGTAEVFAMLEVPTAREDIVVEAVPPAVDGAVASPGQSAPHGFYESLPVEAREPESVVQAVPGVTGGSRPYIQGGGRHENTFTVDGVSVTDPVDHTFGTSFNYDAVSDVQVMTAGYGPQFATTLELPRFRGRVLS